MAPARFVAQRLWALMRESQHLGTLLVDKTLVVPVYYFMIRKTCRGIFKVFQNSENHLALALGVIFRCPNSRSAEAAPQTATVETMPQWAENDSHQIRREIIVSTNARISAPRNTSRRLNINTYTIYDTENLSRSFESVPNVGNRSTFDGTMRFSGAKSGHLQGWTRNQWYPTKWSFWAWFFMDFPFQPQLLATLAPSSGRVWECWDTFLICTARDLAI